MAKQQLGQAARLPACYKVVYYKVIATWVNYLKFSFIPCTVTILEEEKTPRLWIRCFIDKERISCLQLAHLLFVPLDEHFLS